MRDRPGREADTTGRGDVASARPHVRARHFRAPRWLSLLCKTAGWSFIVFGVSIAAFFFVLSRGPITFEWLAPKLVESLDEQFGRRYQFALSGATIANTDHGPTLSIEGLTAAEGGRAIFSAPRAEISLELRSLFLGRMQPRRIEVLDLELRLAVMPDGSMAISAGAGEAVPLSVPVAEGAPAAGPAAPQKPIARTALLRQAAGALHELMDFATSPDSAIGALDRVGVSHGRLVIDDKTIGRVFAYDNLSLSLDKNHGGMHFAAGAQGPARRWTALAAATGAPGGRREFAAQLHDVSIDEFALVGGVRNLKFDTGAPMSLDWRFVLGENDRLLEAKGRFDIGAGFFRLEEPDHEPVMIDAVSGEMAWDKDQRKLKISPLVFKAGGFDMALAGEVAAPLENSARDAWRFLVKLQKPTHVAPERANEKTVQIESGQLAARFLADDKKIVFEKFEFAGPEVGVAFSGAMSWGGGPHIDYSLQLANTQIRALTRLWPTHVAQGVRNWFLDHVTAGVIRHAAYSADFDAAALTAMRYEHSPPDKSVTAEFDIANATLVDLAAGLPPLSGVSGKARVTGRTGVFNANSGAMETAAGHKLTVSEARFTVADNMIDPIPAVLDMRLGGSVEAVADLLTIPSIAAHASLPIDASAIKGQIEGKLRIEFEMGAKARSERMALTIDASTANVSIEHFVGKEKLENAALNVISDRWGLRVNGAGRLYGAPAALELHRMTGDKNGAQAQLTLQFDEAARQKAGYVLPGVSGPVSASIKTPLPIAEVDTQIELDLTRTNIDNPLPGLVKPAGRPGKASFVLAKRSDGGMALEQFQLDAGAAQAQGVIELGRDGAFKSAKLSQARLSPGDDMRVETQRSGEAMKITVRGSNFDARPMLKVLMQGAPERAAGAAGKAAAAFDDFDLDLKSPIVTGNGKQILSNVEFRLEKRGGRPRAVSLTGNFGRDQLAVVMVRNQNGLPQLEISTNDAGSFLSFIDLYQKMDNGALTASVQLGDRRADGELRIKDFYLKHEPTMRQLMAQGGAERAERGGVRFDPDSVRIGQLQTAFGWSPGRLSLREGVMSGPEIGLTFDGTIDFARDRLDLGGSYVPAYAINSLLSHVPVLNVFITGGQNEGIFALNYRLTGVIGSPVINVNPLSAIAPGLMRKILGVIDGSVRPPDGGR